MIQRKWGPPWLFVGAMIMVAQDLVFFVLAPLTALSAVGLAVGMAIVWFLLHGSRVAWVFATLSAAIQLFGPLTMGQSVWVASVGAVILPCLLAPSSRTFVWTQGPQRPPHRVHATVERPYGQLLELVTRLVTRVSTAMGSPSRGVFLSLLATLVIVLLPLDGVLRKLHSGSEHGSIVVMSYIESCRSSMDWLRSDSSSRSWRRSITM